MARLAVVDASIAVKWLFEEPGTTQALKLRDEWEKNDILPCAPEFLLVELHNVFWKKLQMTPPAADDPLFDLSPTFGLDLNWLPTPPLLPQALRLALASKITVYDALYVAAAKAMDAPFHTADKNLAARLKGETVSVHLI